MRCVWGCENKPFSFRTTYMAILSKKKRGFTFVSSCQLTSQYLKVPQKMEIKEVIENKKRYLPLLLLADEQEDMIDLYLDRGTMYVLEDRGVKAECVVTDEGDGILEIKNLAVQQDSQRKGFGRQLVEFVASTYKGKYSVLQVGTGDSPLTIPFYEKCGFVRSHVIKNFFIDHYDHTIYEGGQKLVDMVYFRRKL